MYDKLQDTFTLIGRLLMAALFLPAGIGKISGFSGTAGYIASMGLPLPELGAAIAVIVEIAGGIALILGLGTRHAALALAIFTVAATFIFHNYWAMPADKQMVQQLMFFKNIAVTGGLLFLAAWGPGAWSIDSRRKA